MKIEEIRRKNEKELQYLLLELREKLRQLRFDHAAGKLKNIQDIRNTKKTIARILTVLNERRGLKEKEK
jgi:large subunit ribosomal protein L29